MLINYLNTLKNQGNFTYETIANLSGIPEATIKNVFSGKTEDPRFETVSAIVKAMGGSLDAIYDTHHKGSTELNTMIILKELYEKHLADVKDHYEHRLSEIKEHYIELKESNIEMKARHEERIAEINEHIKTIKLDKRWFRIATCVCVITLVGFFVLELLTPGMGWVRY